MTAWFLLAPCLGAAALGGVLLARRRYLVVTVAGNSMTPAFRDGDRLLLRRSVPERLRVGMVVVFRGQGQPVPKRPPPPGLAGTVPLSMKRVAAVPGDEVPDQVRRATRGTEIVPGGVFVVLADNPAGADSRDWGFIPAADLLGPVVLKLPRPALVPGAGSGCPRSRAPVSRR